MSLVSSYPTSAYPTNSPSSDIGSASMTTTVPSSSPYYGQQHHHQTLVAIGDYSTVPQHQGFYTSSNWSWPNAANSIPSDYQHHVHQQPSPPLSCYSSSAPSPDYYTFNSHQQTVQQNYDAPIEDNQSSIAPQRVVRVVKRRNTANKKERRRTMLVNNAFSDLRDCIPNVPADTKLSKIKTLRLATSYISYLMAVLETGSDSDIPFRAELGRQSKSDKLAAQHQQQQQQQQMQQMQQQQQQQQQVSHQQQTNNNQQQYNVQSSCINKEQVREEPSLNATALCPPGGDKRTKGRTGWPHHVWALELKQ